MNCHLCDRTPDIALMAVRVCDGDLIDSFDLCRDHAFELFTRGRQPFDVPKVRLEPVVQDCVARGCQSDCELRLCVTGCGKYADIWLTAGTDDEITDLDRGILLCGECMASTDRIPDAVCTEMLRSLGYQVGNA